MKKILIAVLLVSILFGGSFAVKKSIDPIQGEKYPEPTIQLV